MPLSQPKRLKATKKKIHFDTKNNWKNYEDDVHETKIQIRKLIDAVCSSSDATQITEAKKMESNQYSNREEAACSNKDPPLEMKKSAEFRDNPTLKDKIKNECNKTQDYKILEDDIYKIQQKRINTRKSRKEAKIRSHFVGKIKEIERVTEVQVQNCIHRLQEDAEESFRHIAKAKNNILGSIEILNSYHEELSMRENQLKATLKEAENSIKIEAKNTMDSKKEEMEASLRDSLNSLLIPA